LSTLLYDENGQLNAAGQQINDLANSLNGIANFINNLGKGLYYGSGSPLFNLIPGRKDVSPISVPTFGTIDTQINPGSLRGIRGSGSGVNITVQTGIGDPIEIGRQVYNVLNNFERRNGGR